MGVGFKFGERDSFFPGRVKDVAEARDLGQGKRGGGRERKGREE